MKLKPIVIYSLFAVMIALAFTACPTDPDDPPPVEPPPSAITWTLTQSGGVLPENNNVPTSSTTAIVIALSGAVSLTDFDITIGGAASRNNASPLNSSENVCIVPVTVNTTYYATVTINKSGVAGGTKNVMVYKEGEKVPTDWTAVANGTSNSVTSTAITFTFTEAVTDLTADNITLKGVTGSATRGTLSGDGTIWTLNITVSNQGEIKVAINKTGITTIEKTVQVYKKSENLVSGKTTYLDYMYMYVFSTASGNSGTYTVYRPKSEEYEVEIDGNVYMTARLVYDANGKYIWDNIQQSGSYTWNQSAQTVTLTQTQVFMRIPPITDEAGSLMTRAEYKNAYRSYYPTEAKIREAFEQTISMLMGENTTRDQAEQWYLQTINGQYGTSFNTIEQVIKNFDTLIDAMLDRTFAPKSYNYSSSNDGASLFLMETLPAPKGTDQLAGKTYYYYEEQSSGQYVKNENRKFVFSSSGRTYTYTNWGETYTGSYSYDSTQKMFYYRSTTINGKSPADYYDSVNIPAGDNEWNINRYPDDAAYRTAETNSRLGVDSYQYDPSLLGFGYFD